jgi:hypothetical protein
MHNVYRIIAYEVDADLSDTGASPIEIPAARDRSHDAVGRRDELGRPASGRGSELIERQRAAARPRRLAVSGRHTDRPVEGVAVLRCVRGMEQHRGRPGGADLQALLRAGAR